MSGSQTTLMLSSACCRLTKFAAYARAHGARRSREFAVNFILPILIFNFISPSRGAVEALMIASTPRPPDFKGDFFPNMRVGNYP
ncbi:MAG: hypothetical protein WAK41_02535 [Roseiarcus sp.]|uniref:hypothetical protein n=1 Tax=Roseiarcus sp. TaxID=1969460 RepID=UPI003BB1F4B5